MVHVSVEQDDSESDGDLSRNSSYDEDSEIQSSDQSDCEIVYENISAEIKDYIVFPIKKSKEFFNEYGKRFPSITAAASDYLFIPATSVPCESLFS